MAKMTLKLNPFGALMQAFATQPADGWPAVEGTVRPATPREVDQYRGELDRSKDATRTQAEFFAAHLKTWDVCGEDEAPLPITPEALLALPFPVWRQLQAVVLGAGGGEVLGNGPR